MHIPEACLVRLCDPEAFSADEAVEAARSIGRLLPGLDVELADWIRRQVDGLGSNPRVIERAMYVLRSISKRAEPVEFAA